MLRRKKFSYAGYPPEFDENFKREIRKRDGLCCAICHTKARLDVHHIDYRKYHTTRFNCISLCRDCHQMIHRSAWVVRQEWKYKLWKITAEREGSYGKSSIRGI
jgi:hypothetical protein